MSSRDPRTGRFVATSNTPESSEGKFDTYTDLPVEIQGADPREFAYETEPRYAPTGDDLAQGGQWPLLRPRHPVLVAADEEARTRYGDQAALLRDAARMSDVGGMAAHVLGIDDAPRPSRGVQGTRVEVHDGQNPLSPGADLLRQPPGRTPGRVQMVTDDEPMGPPGGDLRPASRGLGRGRDR